MRTLLNAPLTVLFFVVIRSSGAFAWSIKRDNPLGIDYDPAPLPEYGPPESVGALRDKAYLPAEIGGIVGSYVFILLVIGVLWLLVGRRLRRESQRSLEAFDVEMIRPRIDTTNLHKLPLSPASPRSGGRNFSYPTTEKPDQTPYIFPTLKGSPTSPGYDSSVDVRIVEADRELLQRDLEDLYAHVMEQEEAKAAGVKPADLPTPRYITTQGQVPAVAPQRQTTLSKSRDDRNRPSNLYVDRSANDEGTHSRTSSIISSIISPKRKGIRGMRISSPIPTPLSSTFPAMYASDEEPLSPRQYSPPPPPPIPKDQVPFTHSRNNSNDTSPVSPTRSIAEQLAPHNSADHKSSPSQASQQSTRGPLSGNPPTQAQILARKTNTANKPNSSQRALPFRAFDPPAGLASPSFSHSTKTTVLERTAPWSPGVRTPWSAGATPYSPYQPFSPLIPVTPRLVTKQERKMRQKLEAKTPVTEMIKSDGDLWDSAY